MAATPPASMAGTNSPRVAKGPTGRGAAHRRGSAPSWRPWPRRTARARPAGRAAGASPPGPAARGPCRAPIAFVVGGAGHGVRLVKGNDAVEIASEPVHELLQPARLAVSLVRAQRR